MKLSIIVATNRPQHWPRLCESLSENDVEMEVLFVGPADFYAAELPVPVKLIAVSTSVPPAQCWEIGARACDGDLVAFPPDDCVFSPGYLDAVVKQASANHVPHDTFSGRYCQNGRKDEHAQRFWSNSNMPLMPVGGFSFLDTHIAMGGIDRRFKGVLWDVDLYMHMYQCGGRTTILEDHTCDELNNAHLLVQRCYAVDRAVLDSLWPSVISPDMIRRDARRSWTEAETRVEEMTA